MSDDAAAAGREPAPPGAILAPGHTFTHGHRQDRVDRRCRAARRSSGSSASAVGFAADDGAPRRRRRTSSSRASAIWGVNIPVGWGFDIINFVWWIGIGHAGTLISAILLLLRQQWRTSINRFAEAMTIFAVACAGLYPAAPHSAARGSPTGSSPTRTRWRMWPQLPQPAHLGRLRGLDVRHGLAALLVRRPDPGPRDAARPRATKLWAKIALRHARDGLARLGAALAPLRDGVPAARRPRDAARRLGPHRRVASTSRSASCPGWHATIFPPYFVAGAIFAGFAMVLTLAIPLRKVYGLEDFITAAHLENMAKIMLATGLIVAYGYVDRGVHGLVQRQPVRAVHDLEPHAAARTAHVLGAASSATSSRRSSLWFRQGPRAASRRSSCIAMIVNVGMWLERFVIIVVEPAPRLPAVVLGHVPRRRSGTGRTFVGTIGLFLALLFLFIRFLPMISIFEMRTILPEAEGRGTEREGNDAASAALRPDGRVREPARRSSRPRAGRARPGYRSIDAYTPYPDRGAGGGARHPRPRSCRLVVLGGGILGGLGGFALQYWTSRHRLPAEHRRASRFHSWPAFIPITFETDDPLRRLRGGPRHARR